MERLSDYHLKSAKSAERVKMLGKVKSDFIEHLLASDEFKSAATDIMTDIVVNILSDWMTRIEENVYDSARNPPKKVKQAVAKIVAKEMYGSKVFKISIANEVCAQMIDNGMSEYIIEQVFDELSRKMCKVTKKMGK